MYTRNTRNGGRYNPPPGYNGSAFDDNVSVKHHEPEYEDQSLAAQQTVQIKRKNEVADERRAFEELIRSIRGKIGSEELIILIVMLLTATEGIGIETILLALVPLVR